MSRGRIIFCALLLAVAGLAMLAWLAFREPHAQGESLSYWLKLGGGGDPFFMDERRNSPDSEAAIREIGAKAIPTLLNKLQATDPPWKEQTYEWLNKQDFYKFEPAWAQEEQAQGIYGFQVLGSNALSALPELERMFWDTNTSWAAAKALEQLGLAALSVLRAGLAHTNPIIRQAALNGTTSTDLATATLPDIRPLRHDSDWIVSAISLRRLMQFASREEATQLTIETLTRNRGRLRGFVLSALEKVSIETNRVVPLLVPLLNDPDPRFRRVVTNTLKNLDPVAAAAAGIDTNPPPSSSSNGRPRQRGRAPAATNNPAALQQ